MTSLVTDVEVKDNLLQYYKSLDLEIRDYKSRIIDMQTDCAKGGFEPSRLLSKYKIRVITLEKVKREIEKCLYGRELDEQVRGIDAEDYD